MDSCWHLYTIIYLVYKPPVFHNWATSWENLFMLHANNKDTDQPAHPLSLISAFVVRFIDSIIPLASLSNISRLCLASVAEQAGLCLTWSQTPKTGFLVTRLIYFGTWFGALPFTFCWPHHNLYDNRNQACQCGEKMGTMIYCKETVYFYPRNFSFINKQILWQRFVKTDLWRKT